MISNIAKMLVLPEPSAWLGLCVALGSGLLIGVERERRKGHGPTRSAAGIRTFTLTAVLGAVAVLVGGGLVLAVVTAAVGIIVAIAYLRTRPEDPGITTEIALVFTCVLGGFAVRQPLLAAGVGVAAAALLAARNRLHHFVLSVLTEQELHDFLVLAGIALVVLPLAPDRFMGPFDALNPHAIARLISLVMAISALGYVATRALGPRYGLPLAGFAAGFVSSTATIHSMGQLAKLQVTQTSGAVAGAVLSSIATIIQLAIVVASVQPTLMKALTWPLVTGGAVACVYGLILMWMSHDTGDAQPIAHLGRAFDLRTALGFGAIVSFILVLSAALNVRSAHCARIRGHRKFHSCAVCGAQRLARRAQYVGCRCVNGHGRSTCDGRIDRLSCRRREVTNSCGPLADPRRADQQLNHQGNRGFQRRGDAIRNTHRPGAGADGGSPVVGRFDCTNPCRRMDLKKPRDQAPQKNSNENFVNYPDNQRTDFMFRSRGAR